MTVVICKRDEQIHLVLNYPGNEENAEILKRFCSSLKDWFVRNKRARASAVQSCSYQRHYYAVAIGEASLKDFLGSELLPDLNENALELWDACINTPKGPPSFIIHYQALYEQLVGYAHDSESNQIALVFNDRVRRVRPSLMMRLL